MPQSPHGSNKNSPEKHPTVFASKHLALIVSPSAPNKLDAPNAPDLNFGPKRQGAFRDVKGQSPSRERITQPGSGLQLNYVYLNNNTADARGMPIEGRNDLLLRAVTVGAGRTNRRVPAASMPRLGNILLK